MINRFHLKGDLSHRQQLLESLENQRWPAQDHEHCFIIRRLEVRGCWWNIAEKSVQLAHEAKLEAVCGWGAAAEQAGIVRFDSTAAMLACLLRDISTGQRHWFWQSRPEAALPQTEAISQIVSEHVTLLPEMIAVLERRQLPLLFLTHLDASRIEALMMAIAASTGWSLTFAAAETERPARLPAREAMMTAPVVESLMPWRTLVADTRGLHREKIKQLAAVITAWRFAPQVLAEPQRTVQWYRKIEALLVEDAVVERQPPTQIHQAARRETSGEGLRSPRRAAEVTLPQQAANVDGERDKKMAEAHRFGEDLAGDSSRPPTQQEMPALPPFEETTPTGFITQSGGFFYLLALCRNPVFFASIDASHCSPWLWLYRLARCAGYRPDAALSEFLAEQLSLDGMAALAAMKPVPGERELYEQLSLRFEKYPFWPTEMFTVPALVRLDNAALDIYFHTASINIDIRMAGLDINPGWLPWMGRVVSFYYGDDERLLPISNEEGERC